MAEHTLADTGGLLVCEVDDRVLVIDRRTSALCSMAFVLAVATLVLGGFGLVALLVGIPPRGLGAAFMAAGLVLAGLTALVLRTIRRRRSQPPFEGVPVAVLDRRSGLFSYPGDPVVPLQQVRFERRLQVGSSSPKLVAVTPAGVRIIKRGNPFDGGIGKVHEVLNAAARGS